MKLSKLEREQIASNAKRANQRLREMERAGLETLSPAYQEVKGLFYLQDIIDETDIFSLTKNGQIKFRTDISRVARESPEKLRLLQQRLESFLNARTSTVKGIKSREEGIQIITQRMRDKYGKRITETTVRNMMADERLMNRLTQYMSSDTAAIIMNDVSEGKINAADMSEYLDRVDAGEFGFSLADLYSYKSTTADSDWEPFDNMNW